MNIIECDDLEILEDRMYGGATGSKIAVRYKNRVWMLKRQQKLRDRYDMKNIEISYANDVISEYIGSHIYSLFGIPVHDTLLGMYKDKLCVLCSDDVYPGKLYELREFRNTLFDEDILQPSSGMSTKISDIMETIEKSDRIETESAKKRFWTMFVIDALIGNTDRNNGNWGFVYNNSKFILYQVYDCGGCLNNKRSEDQLHSDMFTGKIETMAINYSFNFKNDKGKRINPFHYIRDNRNRFIDEALDLVCSYDFHEIDKLVDSVKPIISDTRAEYYKRIMYIRYCELCKLRGSNSTGNSMLSIATKTRLED